MRRRHPSFLAAFLLFLATVNCDPAPTGYKVDPAHPDKHLLVKRRIEQELSNFFNLADNTGSRAVDAVGEKTTFGSLEHNFANDGKINYNFKLSPESQSHFPEIYKSKGTIIQSPQRHPESLTPVAELEQDLNSAPRFIVHKGVPGRGGTMPRSEEDAMRGLDDHDQSLRQQLFANLPREPEHQTNPNPIQQAIHDTHSKPADTNGMTLNEFPRKAEGKDDPAQMAKLKATIPVDKDGSHFSFKAKLNTDILERFLSGLNSYTTQLRMKRQSKLIIQDQKAEDMANELKKMATENERFGLVPPEETQNLRDFVNKLRFDMTKSIQSFGHITPTEKKAAYQKWVESNEKLQRLSRQVHQGMIDRLLSLLAARQPTVMARPANQFEAFGNGAHQPAAAFSLGNPKSPLESGHGPSVELRFNKREAPSHGNEKMLKKRNLPEELLKVLELFPGDAAIAKSKINPNDGYTTDEWKKAEDLANQIAEGRQQPEISRSFKETANVESAMLQALHHPSSDQPPSDKPRDALNAFKKLKSMLLRKDQAENIPGVSVEMADEDFRARKQLERDFAAKLGTEPLFVPVLVAQNKEVQKLISNKLATADQLRQFGKLNSDGQQMSSAWSPSAPSLSLSKSFKRKSFSRKLSSLISIPKWRFNPRTDRWSPTGTGAKVIPVDDAKPVDPKTENVGLPDLIDLSS